MEALALHTGAPTVHWEDNIRYISAVEYKRVTPRVKKMDITVCFIQEKIGKWSFFPKHKKPSFILAYMCTKPCSGTIISRSTK